MVLSALRDKGLRIGLLSNTFWPAAWHNEILAREGLAGLFDAVVFSSDLSVVKPHPDAFAAVLTGLGGLEPEDCLFVGDRPFEDISGAQAVGMKTVALPERTVAAQHRIAVEVEPTFRIARLTDLIRTVDRWRAMRPNR
jgi:putative hydrolase of the HAD superfamily